MKKPKYVVIIDGDERCRKHTLREAVAEERNYNINDSMTIVNLNTYTTFDYILIIK